MLVKSVIVGVTRNLFKRKGMLKQVQHDDNKFVRNTIDSDENDSII